MRDYKNIGIKKFRPKMLKWLGTRLANFTISVEPRDRTLIVKPITQSKH